MIALVRMSAGLLVWSPAFCLLYGLHGIGCAAGWPALTVAGMSLHRLALLAVWIVCVAAGAAVAFAFRHGRASPALDERTAWLIALTGVAATTITGLPLLLLPDCL